MTAHHDDQPGRVPPQDIDAEMSVLSACLISPDAITATTDILDTGEEFYRPAHQTIYQAIVDMWRAGERPDPITLAAALGKSAYGAYLRELLTERSLRYVSNVVGAESGEVAGEAVGEAWLA